MDRPDPAALDLFNWHSLSFWLLGSIVLYAIASLLMWLLGKVRSPWARRMNRGLRSPWAELAGWVLRVAWLVGPGYAALLLGLVSPRLMGLTQINWGAPFGFAALFALLALAVLLAAGLHYRRAQHEPQPYPSLGSAAVVSIRLLVETGALQWHWAFYRAAVIELGGAAGLDNPLYWGTWLSVALIGLEAALSPLLWRDLRRPGLAERRILRAVLLAATSVIYLLGRNFWLCWAVHALAILLIEPRLGEPGPEPDNKEGSWGRDHRQQPSQPEETHSAPL